MAKLIKPSAKYIDDGSSANDIFRKFVESGELLDVPGYYKYITRTDDPYAIRCGQYPDFTNPKETIFLPENYSIRENEKIPPSGILRYNYLENRFEISKEFKYKLNGNDTYFHPISGDFSGFRGKIFLKNLIFSDNDFPNGFIVNKGENKNEFGNILKEVKNDIEETEYKTYEQQNLFSNPTFIYTGNNLFDLVQHTLTFSPNDKDSYEVFVEKNYNWPLYDFSGHQDISNNLRKNGFHKYLFQEGFTFYGIKYSNMFINKLGFISFTEQITSLEEVSYEFMLKKKRIHYFSGDQDFTYLSKCYIGLGKSNEVIITFLNVFADTKVYPVNFQIILWEGNSLNKTNLFDGSFNRINYYSDNYEKNGTIKFNYDFTQNEKSLDNFNKILVGLSNNINYLSSNFQPLYFSNLIEKKEDLLNSNGIPNLKAKLLFKDENFIGINRENLINSNFDKKNFFSDEMFTTITDIKKGTTDEVDWETYYRRNNNGKDFFIKIAELKINDLNFSNNTKFFMAISTNRDRKFSLQPSLGVINNYGSIRSNNLIEYYSDATQNILFQKLNDQEELDYLDLDDFDEIINNKNVPFEEKEMIDFFKPLLDENRKLEFVDLFPLKSNQYKYKSIFDSILYRIQLNKSSTFDIEDYNTISDEEINSIIYQGLNLKNRKFKGFNITKKKGDPKYYLKVIFNSKASKNPINNTIEKSILISQIGLFGPYNLKKNTVSYFKINLEVDKSYIISLVDLIESESVNYRTKIEIFDGNFSNFIDGNARYDGTYPEVKINSDNLPLVNEQLFIYAKISSDINVFYYGVLFQEYN